MCAIMSAGTFPNTSVKKRSVVLELDTDYESCKVKSVSASTELNASSFSWSGLKNKLQLRKVTLVTK